MVQLKRKVTIKTKHTVDIPDVPEQPAGGNGNEPTPSKKWLWGIIAAIIIVACIVGFMKLNSSSNNTGGTTPTTTSSDTTVVEKTDSVQTKQNQSEAKDAKTPNGESEEKADVKESNASPKASENATTSESTKAKETSTQFQNSSSEYVDATKNQSTGSVEDEARQVIRGIYGNGSVRKQKLGNRYSEIQSKVNEMYRTGQVR